MIQPSFSALEDTKVKLLSSVEETRSWEEEDEMYSHCSEGRRWMLRKCRGNSLLTEGCVEWRCPEAIFKLGLGDATQWVYGGTGTTFDLVKTETLISVPSHFFPLSRPCLPVTCWFCSGKTNQEQGVQAELLERGAREEAE